jgi:hypothetical protein
MRYWLPALLVAGLVAVAGYALVQPLQTTSQALTTSTTTMSAQNQATETVHQTADKPLRLNIAMDGVRVHTRLHHTPHSQHPEHRHGRGLAGILHRPALRSHNKRRVRSICLRTQRHRLPEIPYGGPPTSQAGSRRKPHGNHRDNSGL